MAKKRKHMVQYSLSFKITFKLAINERWPPKRLTVKGSFNGIKELNKVTIAGFQDIY